MLGRAASICAGVTFGPGNSAALSISSIVSMNLMSTVSMTSCGTSTRSFLFFFGMRKILIPARCAARSFSFTPPMGKTSPRSVISPVIATSLRTLLGDGPRRDMDVHGVVLEEALRHTELRVVRPHVAERRDGRLLHDLLDLAGEDELLLLRSLVHDRRLNGEDVAAVLGHRNAGGRADLVLLLGEAVLVPLGTEVRREVFGLDLDRLGLALGDRSRDLAVDRPDLPLEVADAGLARVLADEPEERVVGHHELAFLETVLLQLLRQEEALRDVHLLVL